MNIIEITSLAKDYASNGMAVKALRDIALSIGPGEFTAIAGPSGSGKTTLLNIIGGLDRPSKGSVRVNGRELADMSPRELSDLRLMSIGFIFQAYNLIPVLSAMENVEYILLLQGSTGRSAANVQRAFSPRSVFRKRSTVFPGKCPAASSSGSPWPGLLSPSRPSSLPTSRQQTSIRRPEPASWTSCMNSTGQRELPLSFPPMMPW